MKFSPFGIEVKYLMMLDSLIVQCIYLLIFFTNFKDIFKL